MTTDIEKTTEHMATEFSALRDDVARLTATLGELLRLQGKAAGDAAVDAVGAAKNGVADSIADATVHTRAAGAEIEASIERNPMTALVIAFGVGISVGMISRFHR